MTNEDLVLLAKAGDTTAYNQLFEENKGFAYYVADKFKNTKLERDDRVSLAYLGMVKAFRTFDATKENKFITYAYCCMSNEIKMGLTRKKVLPVISIDSLIMPKSGDEETIDLPYMDDRFDDVEDISLVQDVVNTVRQKIKKSKEREAFENLFIRNLNQQETADQLGLSQSYVSRLEKHLRKEIRKTAVRRGCI